ncbi:hypothetical protein SAMN05421770_103236 [Granulicella rosea]|uniref:Uncharacterized protein n=1 Tax=Granulicella rosea TaxID=474952 RepID=A0A239ISQ5_9BACT|nr:hypothetical protein [Granulicella rosea]SNS96073.1 hypothetical protein SAMN05421770_103236 [Granulicella rosea]
MALDFGNNDTTARPSLQNISPEGEDTTDEQRLKAIADAAAKHGKHRLHENEKHVPGDTIFTK